MRLAGLNQQYEALEQHMQASGPDRDLAQGRGHGNGLSSCWASFVMACTHCLLASCFWLRGDMAGDASSGANERWAGLDGPCSSARSGSCLPCAAGYVPHTQRPARVWCASAPCCIHRRAPTQQSAPTPDLLLTPFACRRPPAPRRNPAAGAARRRGPASTATRRRRWWCPPPRSRPPPPPATCMTSTSTTQRRSGADCCQRWGRGRPPRASFATARMGEAPCCCATSFYECPELGRHRLHCAVLCCAWKSCAVAGRVRRPRDSGQQHTRRRPCRCVRRAAAACWTLRRAASRVASWWWLGRFRR